MVHTTGANDPPTHLHKERHDHREYNEREAENVEERNGYERLAGCQSLIRVIGIHENIHSKSCKCHLEIIIVSDSVNVKKKKSRAAFTHLHEPLIIH